ncbi:MAG: hypothetical protein AB1443_11515 [Pseudomonadota bacterium]
MNSPYVIGTGQSHAHDRATHKLCHHEKSALAGRHWSVSDRYRKE